MTAAVFAFDECSGSARGLAEELRIPYKGISIHHFPDEESLVRVPPEPSETAILYRSLDRPNDKIVELLLAASALRARGTARIVLVAPYLAYMRQDREFHPGEAVSQRVIGELLAHHFDSLFTVDPHLHRIDNLSDVMPGMQAVSLSAAEVIASAIDTAVHPVIIGPDSESRQWAERIARPSGLETLIGHKQRAGDRAVTIAFPEIDKVRNRTAILVDDVISSGETLAQASQLLQAAGAKRIEALATHCLARPEDLKRLEQAGIVRVRSTDSIAGPTACLPIAPILASALQAAVLSVRH